MKRKSENQVKEYDIEVFSNYFQTGIKDFRTKEVLNLEVSEEFDNREKIYEFFSNYNGYLISFNGIHYDNFVIKFFLKEWKMLRSLPKEYFLKEIKNFSDRVIYQEQNWDLIKKYLYFEVNWIDIDLFCFWSRMLRISKKISLKSLGIQLNYPTVMELPFSPEKRLELAEIRQIRAYNNIHDLGILDSLAERMKDDIKLRLNIRKDYDLPCLSWDAIKIASEALLQDYCKEIGKTTKEIRNLRYVSSNFPIKSILKDFDPDYKTKLFKDFFKNLLTLYSEDLKSTDFTKDFLVLEGNTSIRLSYSSGGLHSVNENEIYESTKTHKIRTSDFASLYPNLIINYECIRFLEVLKRYSLIKEERIQAKKNKDKNTDIFKKLILNGVSGLLDNHHSWLYFPEGALKMRLIGQLIMTKVIDTCLVNKWQVISVNTDGIEAIVPVDEIDRYNEELSFIEKQFNLEFEHENYQKIVYTNVNNYICQKESGKLKKKGLYKTREDLVLGDSVNELIIPQALEKYFINNIPVEETIRSSKDIYDFTCSKKIDKTYSVFYNGSQVQNLNRYYFSTPAPLLLKKKKAKSSANFENVNVGDPVLLFNEYEEKPIEDYKINYNHYIRRAKEIIGALEIKKQQLSLF